MPWACARHGMYNVAKTDTRYVKFHRILGPEGHRARAAVVADGPRTNIVTDTSGRHGRTDHLHQHLRRRGLRCAARAAGWDRPGFNDASWAPATASSGAQPALIARQSRPSRYPGVSRRGRLPSPTGSLRLRPGAKLRRVARHRSQRCAGAVVRLTPGELLDSGGWSPRSAWAADGVERIHLARRSIESCILGSLTRISLRPVSARSRRQRRQISSPPPDRQPDGSVHQHLIRSQRGRSHVRQRRESHSSIIVAAARSNLQSLLTDCPQREKLAGRDGDI